MPGLARKLWRVVARLLLGARPIRPTWDLGGGWRVKAGGACSSDQGYDLVYRPPFGKPWQGMLRTRGRLRKWYVPGCN